MNYKGMTKIPKFKLYGQGDPEIKETLQPKLELRNWHDLGSNEKQIAFQELRNKGWVKDRSLEILATIDYLNDKYLRQTPGKNLHQIPPLTGPSNKYERRQAALDDFYHIFMHEDSEEMVYVMLTKFAQQYVDAYYYHLAETTEDPKEQEEYTSQAFWRLDNLVNCLNHIFEQFSVNVVLTRSGLIPRQDEKITTKIYIPTLKILADPKWKTVNDDLSKMFKDYGNKNYPETITKAHGVVQRFLQILVGEEGKSGKGEVSKLFAKAKKDEAIPINRFTEPIIKVFQGFIASERATNSTAKPAKKTATSSDALLIMNVVMVFLQHCLQKEV
jgi:hypothetical protein